MLIRDAEPSELDEIGSIRVAAYRADDFLATEYEPRLRSLGGDGCGDVLVAVRDDELIGTVMLQHWPQAGQVVTGPEEAEIRALAVLPTAQSEGVGKALLDAVIDRATRHRVRHLVLCTQTDMTTAHRLYESAGFVRLRDRDWSPIPGFTLLAYGLALS